MPIPKLHQLTFTVASTCSKRAITATTTTIRLSTAATRHPLLRQQVRHISIFPSKSKPSAETPKPEKNKSKISGAKAISAVLIGALLISTLNNSADQSQQQRFVNPASNTDKSENGPNGSKASDGQKDEEQSAWWDFSGSFEKLSAATDLLDASKLSDKVVDLILPEWSKHIPVYVRKLQRELNMDPGSLAAEIWQEARDPSVHPEIQYTSKVRVSDSLCDDEKKFLERRRKITAMALSKYLGLKESDVHPDDVPVIAMCGSGGGLRALVAGTGSFLATAEDGLFDCVTYTSGVSGSCWLQALYHSSVTGGDLHRAIDHLKARLGIHIAYPPTAFMSLVSAPTNKYLLSGMVEKLKGDNGATLGLVDAYGILLASRLLVPRGELGVSEDDFKLSRQRENIRYGQNPLPIYTAVRHEIPELDDSNLPATEDAKNRAKKEAWFQWFEMTPYELFCEEFGAGIPTWAMGRKFKGGVDVPSDGDNNPQGFRLPETRMPLLLGIWGSAFCATLSHYYREVRPLIKSLAGLQAVDELIWGHNEDLSKVHPIDPATLPNFLYGMKEEQLPRGGTVPKVLYESEYVQLMDAGMSNNLPIYPLLRPGRDVDVVVAFDASADIKTENWLSVVEGYARQRGVKGWPVGIGWPKPKQGGNGNEREEGKETARQLDKAEKQGVSEGKVEQAKAEQASRQSDSEETADSRNSKMTLPEKAAEAEAELGYCTVWVGTTQERSSDDPPPPPARSAEQWRLMEPDAGIAVIYLPFLANEDKVKGIDPAQSDFMSTWNFIYTPEQVDKVVELAKANYSEGRERIRETVRAVYERKKKKRLQREEELKEELFRRRVRLGVEGKLGEGDHFS